MKNLICRSRFFKKLVEIKLSAGVLENEAAIREAAYKQIFKIICCIFAVSFLIFVFVGTYQEKEGVIRQGSIVKDDWETGYELHYEAEEGQISGNTQITVPQKNYTKQEAQKLFQQVEENLETEVLGNNQSLEQVNSDLNFVDYLDGIPVEITWSTDKEEYINAYGQVFNFSIESEGEIVMITATLSLGEYEKEFSFPVCVVLPDKIDSSWWQRAVQYKLETLLEQTSEQNQVLLPQQIAGREIAFSEKHDRRPWEYLLAIPLLAVLLFYGTLKEEEKQKGKKEEELLREYPEIVSRLSLYIQSGMTSKKAIGKIVGDYEKLRITSGKKGVRKFGYEELRVTYYEMQSGVSEHTAYKNLGERTGLTEYKKVSAILVQQLEKGSRSFLDNLQQETREAFEKRKRNAKEVGEKAGTKLLFPMGILLVITLVVIMTPAFLSFAF